MPANESVESRQVERQASLPAEKRGLAAEPATEKGEQHAETLLQRVQGEIKHLSKRFYLRGVKVSQAIEVDDFVVLKCPGRIGLLVGKDGSVVRELGKTLGKKVRVVQEGVEEKKWVQDLVGKARIQGIDKTYALTGNRVRVRIDHRHRHRLALPPASLAKALTALYGLETTVAFS